MANLGSLQIDPSPTFTYSASAHTICLEAKLNKVLLPSNRCFVGYFFETLCAFHVIGHRFYLFFQNGNTRNKTITDIYIVDSSLVIPQSLVSTNHLCSYVFWFMEKMNVGEMPSSVTCPEEFNIQAWDKLYF